MALVWAVASCHTHQLVYFGGSPWYARTPGSCSHAAGCRLGTWTVGPAAGSTSNCSLCHSGCNNVASGFH